MHPVCHASNILSTFVAFVGLVSFAIVTGLSFSKFSKPQAHVIFSKNMLIAPNPRKGMKKSLQFRIANASNNQIIDVTARATLTWLESTPRGLKRKFERLDLELENIHLFPLNWTIVHPIDEISPLYGKSLDNLTSNKMELLVLIQAFDDTYTRTIHTKRSYACSELIHGAVFDTMYENRQDKTIVDLSKISSYTPYQFS